jgi:hypothetical protein
MAPGADGGDSGINASWAEPSPATRFEALGASTSVEGPFRGADMFGTGSGAQKNPNLNLPKRDHAFKEKVP